MSQQAAYFFINHTRKEYCLFDNNESIVSSVELTIYKNLTWESTDDIRVEFQDSDSTTVWEQMGEEGYKDLDEIESVDESKSGEDDDMLDDAIDSMTKLKVN